MTTWERVPGKPGITKRIGADGKPIYRGITRGPDGRQVTKNARTLREIEAWRAEKRSSRDRGDWVDSTAGRVAFGTYFASFLETEEHARRASTVSWHRNIGRVHLLPTLADVPLNKITPATVRDLLAKLSKAGVGASSVSAAHRVLRTVLGRAVEDGRIARNPAATAPAPAARKRAVRFLTAAEVSTIADEVPPVYRALVLTLGWAGLRIGEAAALRIEDVDLLRGRIQVVRAAAEVEGRRIEGETKTGKSRTVAIPRFLGEEISRHIRDHRKGAEREDLLFVSERGEPVRQGNFRRRIFQPAAGRAKVSPIPRVHDLRHTAVALRIAAGSHAKEIQEAMGHSSIAVTFDIYGHLFGTLQESGAERLEELYQRRSDA